MHTAELLDEALTQAAQLGYRVRHEWLDGDGGGPCVVRGEKWLFVDLAQPLAEQLECVAGVLRGNSITDLPLSPSLAEHLIPAIAGDEKPLMNANARY
ncbi:MAG: hypothetical protein WD851_14130 [Pirellulales bacterium]